MVGFTNLQVPVGLESRNTRLSRRIPLRPTKDYTGYMSGRVRPFWFVSSCLDKYVSILIYISDMICY